MRANFAAFVQSYVTDTQTLTPDDPWTQTLPQLVEQYQSQLDQTLDTQMQSVTGNIMTALATQYAGYGWAMAGAFLNTIARVQGSVVDAGNYALPDTYPPSQDTVNEIMTSPENAYQWNKFYNQMINGYEDYKANDSSISAIDCNQTDQSIAGGGATTPVNTKRPEDSGKEDYVNDVLGYVDGELVNNGVLSYLNMTTISNPTPPSGAPVALFVQLKNPNPGTPGNYSGAAYGGTSPMGANACGQGYFSLGYQLHTANPLAEIAYFGHKNINAALGMLNGVARESQHRIFNSTLLNMLPYNEHLRQTYLGSDPMELAKATQQLEYFSFRLSVLTTISTILFGVGYTLAFVVPLMPFLRFFFNVLTWVVSLLEAVVAIPLVALAHLNPEGEGLPGPSAKAAYFMIFNLFLRPVLTIFGLICGLIVFLVAIAFLNQTFSIAVAGTAAMYHGYATLSRILYTLTYGATVYVCANNCFKPIGMFPEYAMRWIGAQSHHERMGDAGRAVQGVMGKAENTLGKEGISLAKIPGVGRG